MTSSADQVDYVSGKTRVFGIVGHPIEQVRSPEIITRELTRRGYDAVLVPMHVLPGDFDDVLPRLVRMQNLGGLVFTIPFKARAVALADEVGPQARTLGVINALGRTRDGRWRVSPNLTWFPTEFSKIRLQYNYDRRDELGEDHSVWLQFEFLLGAHAAHKF